MYMMYYFFSKHIFKFQNKVYKYIYLILIIQLYSFKNNILFTLHNEK